MDLDVGLVRCEKENKTIKLMFKYEDKFYYAIWKTE
jgi:hypothetical protein